MKAFKRGKEVDAYLGHEGEVQILLPFGEHLVSIDDKNCLKTWHVRDRGWLVGCHLTNAILHSSVHGCKIIIYLIRVALKTYVLDVMRLKLREVKNQLSPQAAQGSQRLVAFQFSLFIHPLCTTHTYIHTCIHACTNI